MTITAGPTTGDGVAEVDPSFRRIEHFDAASAEHLTGRQLEAIRDVAPAFQQWFRDQGTIGAVRTCDLVALPYPREFALWRAAVSPAPFVRIFNRMMVVQWHDAGGVLRTLLAEPTDYELAANTPFFAKLAQRFEKVQRSIVDYHPTVIEHLATLGISPDMVDYLTFDHLHTQDIRPWLGTTTPQPDLERQGRSTRGEPVSPFFPNARLLVMRDEWEMLAALHPLQRRWFQPETYRDIPLERVMILDHDTLIAPGLALVKTPGHTLGNHTVVLSTSTGIWTSSENGVHAECYEPAMSKIPGLARLADDYGVEVVLNANTPELAAIQYNSMVKEKLIADRGGPGGAWPQHFSSSEMTPWRLSPAVTPSFTYKGITHGMITPAGTAPDRPA